MPDTGARYFVDTLNNKELITVMGCKVTKPPVEAVTGGCKGGEGRLPRGSNVHTEEILSRQGRPFQGEVATHAKMWDRKQQDVVGEIQLIMY